MKKIIALFSIVLIFVSFIVIVGVGYSGYFVVRNTSSFDDVFIDINGKVYSFERKNHIDFSYLFLFDKQYYLSAVKKGKTFGEACEIDFKPFNSCAFEVVVNDKGAFCSKCFPL